MSSAGVVTIDFCDIGLRLGKVAVGSFSGSADVDTDGSVVSICFDVTSRKEGESPYKTVAIGPHARSDLREIATEIEKTYADTIREKLADWEEERGIEGFDARREHGTHRVIGGRLA